MCGKKEQLQRIPPATKARLKVHLPLAEAIDRPARVDDAPLESHYSGSLDAPVPTDPTIYRFYEVLQVYGPTIGLSTKSSATAS